MSVINKVLRDLDSRAAAGPTADPALTVALTRGTASVTAAPRPRGRFPWVGVVLALAVVLLASAAWWWSAGGGMAPRAGERAAASSQPPVAVQAPVAGVAVSGATPLAQPAPAPVAPLAPSVPVMAIPAEQPVAPGLGRVPADAVSAAPLPGKAGSLPMPPLRAAVGGDDTPRVQASLPASAAPPMPAATARTSATPSVESPASAVASGEAPVPWPDAALDAVGQAQRLWNTGAREAALEFLREALTGVERAHAADLLSPGAGATAGLAMVRELVRMEMSQGRHAAVLALLKRHEGLWASQADLWAVRGNAAQRLSQHAESAQAYLVALKLRPGEPRWMLGAAVSLAALGQLVPAAELVEQARAISVVSPEVLAYLRQLGVTLRER